MLLFLTSIVAATIQDLLLLFGYIQNVNSFPQPLNAEEEQYYLAEYRKGNEDAKNILVERNLRLVAHIVKKYSNTGREVDDLISIGTIGLIKAIITFDDSKGTRLATYAARCIENEILMTIRASKKTKTEVSLHDPIGIDKEGNELPFLTYRWMHSIQFWINNQCKLVVSLVFLFFVFYMIQDGFQQHIFFLWIIGKRIGV